MINKIFAHTETSGLHKVITKGFQRGFQHVDTKSAYINNKLYFRNFICFRSKCIFKRRYISGKRNFKWV